MATQFSTIYDRFLGKITDDMYVELTPLDTVKDLQRLLTDALPSFEFPRINLYDYTLDVKSVESSTTTGSDFVLGKTKDILGNDESETKVLVEQSYFAEDLTAEEAEILAILMMNGWLQRQITSIENTRMKYSGSDFKFTSQASHLSKLQSLLEECQRQSHHMQRLYKRRELNDDGKYESTWNWFGENSVL